MKSQQSSKCQVRTRKRVSRLILDSLNHDLTSLDGSKVDEDTQAAISLLADVEAQLESVSALGLT